MNTEEKESSKKVVVALTGRVDSAVAAFLLKKQGYDVVGLAMVVCSESLTESKASLPRCHIDDLEKVRELCSRIKIPFYATDIKSEYDYSVLDRHVENKLNGLANSSCFQCTNLRMKTLFEKMKALNADAIATGHYCKIYPNLNTNEYHVYSNNTSSVDQSMMLAGLPHEILEHLILPLGELRREEVEKIARSFNLNVTPRKEQVEFCFQRDEGKKILEAKVPKSFIKEGLLVNVDRETIYGEHKGLIYHYIGEVNPGGELMLKADKGLEVVDYDTVKKSLIVGPSSELSFKGVQVTNFSISAKVDKRKPLSCYVKFKYSEDYIEVTLFFKNNNSALVEFNNSIYPILKSEQIVIYDSNKRNSKVIGFANVGSRGEYSPLNRLEGYSRNNVDKDEPEDQSSSFFHF